MDTLDNSVQTPADVERLLGLPVAGIIPGSTARPEPCAAHFAFGTLVGNGGSVPAFANGFAFH